MRPRNDEKTVKTARYPERTQRAHAIKYRRGTATLGDVALLS